MECLAFDIKVFGEQVLRLNRCVYCVVESKSRRLIYTFIETQDPLHVSEEWIVFRTRAWPLIATQGNRPQCIQFTPDHIRCSRGRRVLDVNDECILYSNGTVVRFATDQKSVCVHQVDVTEFPLLTPTGFAVQDKAHTKLQPLDRTPSPVIRLLNVVPDGMRYDRYILNHHGDAHVAVLTPTSSTLSSDPITNVEHWVVDAKGQKYLIPTNNPPSRIRRTFIELQDRHRFQRDEKTGEWDVTEEEEEEEDAPSVKNVWVTIATPSTLVRSEDFVGRNASAWMLMNNALKLTPETVKQVGHSK